MMIVIREDLWEVMKNLGENDSSGPTGARLMWGVTTSAKIGLD
jgi:hypothetical protein